MYSQKTYCTPERAQHNYTLADDGSIELGNCPCPSQFLGMQQQQQYWTSGVCQDVPVGQDILGFVKSSGTTTLLSRFESPTSAFYATERCMRFPQYGSTKPSGDAEFPLYRSTCENFSISSGSYDQSSQQDKLQADHGASLWRPVSVPKENQDCKPPLRLSSRSTNSGSSTREFPVSVATVVPYKTRIRWTQDLHEKFVESVNRLGGAEKATPKAILKLMESDGLTIFHIKSHLQKYRIAKYIPDSAEGRSEKKTIIDEVPRYDSKGGLHIKETLQLQLDVQRQLLEQLEIQRKLQLQIEEQGKQLRMMFDQQQKTTKASMSNQKETVCEEDGHFPGVQGSENAQFPSKIS